MKVTAVLMSAKGEGCFIVTTNEKEARQICLDLREANTSAGKKLRAMIIQDWKNKTKQDIENGKS